MSATVFPYTRRNSYLSTTTTSTWRAERRKHAMGKGAVLFTGPDGIDDYRVNVVRDGRHVGIGTMSREGSSELKYLYRAALRTPHPRPKSSQVGEIGWGIPSYTDRRLLRTGMQIKTGEFRQAAEDRHTHLYQNPWYPPPQRSASQASQSPLLPYRPKTVHDFRQNDSHHHHRSSHPLSRPSTASTSRSNRISSQLKATDYHYQISPVPDY
ncbi:protein SPMIP2-like [Saccoglossus kowalevskii]|uniref:Uncharacterized protein C4orf45 homolog n=1 Tax=Saccoglossus kowalevskii TaxID=10224 RepID=A0ABM0GUD3_SACKO|nr:PREDICTED: uncharacterized protein C4orf45 homolog [Saccoglossus kowalevskii]